MMDAKQKKKPWNGLNFMHQYFDIINIFKGYLETYFIKAYVILKTIK